MRLRLARPFGFVALGFVVVGCAQPQPPSGARPAPEPAASPASAPPREGAVGSTAGTSGLIGGGGNVATEDSSSAAASAATPAFGSPPTLPSKGAQPEAGLRTGEHRGSIGPRVPSAGDTPPGKPHPCAAILCAPPKRCVVGPNGLGACAITSESSPH